VPSVPRAFKCGLPAAFRIALDLGSDWVFTGVAICPIIECHIFSMTNGDHGLHVNAAAVRIEFGDFAWESIRAMLTDIAPFGSHWRVPFLTPEPGTWKRALKRDKGILDPRTSTNLGALY
jgi:hypothetical protein